MRRVGSRRREAEVTWLRGAAEISEVRFIQSVGSSDETTITSRLEALQQRPINSDAVRAGANRRSATQIIVFLILHSYVLRTRGHVVASQTISHQT